MTPRVTGTLTSFENTVCELEPDRMSAACATATRYTGMKRDNMGVWNRTSVAEHRHDYVMVPIQQWYSRGVFGEKVKGRKSADICVFVTGYALGD